MEGKVVAGKADQTAFEGEGGAYYVWSNSKSPLLSDSKLGAGKLVLQPFGFAIPHYADASKIGFVLQGNCTVGLISPNASEEQVVLIKKGDVIPLSMATISWWFNGGDTDVVIVFLGETTKSIVPGQFTYFFMAGVLGVLTGFQSDVVSKTFNLNQTESNYITNSQPGALIVKLHNGITFPNPTKHINDKLYATTDTDVVKEGGVVSSLTGAELPMLGVIGLSVRFVKLKGNATLAPSYLANGSPEISYVVKGSGWLRVVGSEGKPVLDTQVEEGDMFIVPQFFATVVVATQIGMEVFSVTTSPKPIVAQLAGNDSVWHALSPIVLQSTLNISQESAQLFKSKNLESIVIAPPNKEDD